MFSSPEFPAFEYEESESQKGKWSFSAVLDCIMICYFNVTNLLKGSIECNFP